MTATRRIGAEDSATRAELLDAAMLLMLQEGYAAVSSRKVAAKAGLKPQLVHYYFRTMDDLFLALVRRGAEQNLERQAAALTSPTPLRAVWEFMTDPAGTVLVSEFSALANHRKAIRAELAAYADQFRALQTQALTRILADYGVGSAPLAPAAVPVLLTAITQILGMEAALGMTTGHAELREAVDAWIARHEPSTNG